MILFSFGYLATASDPTDKGIYYQRYYKDDLRRLENFQSKLIYQCDICELMIQANTKHCRACNRCCDKFDHHCQWLNNCIGYNNYRPFFCTLVFVILHSLAVIGLGIAHILPITSFQSVFTQIGVLDIISLIMIILNAIAAAFIGYLLLYHIWLFKVGKTTYQHILEIRKK